MGDMVQGRAICSPPWGDEEGKVPEGLNKDKSTNAGPSSTPFNAT